MKKLLLAIAVWNTAVMLINVFVLPLFAPIESFVYMTLYSQILPILIPLALWLIIDQKETAKKFGNAVLQAYDRPASPYGGNW